MDLVGPDGLLAGVTKRVLERINAAVFIDAIVVKVRDGQATFSPVYAAIDVTVDGNRDILGLWMALAGRARSSGCRC